MRTLVTTIPFADKDSRPLQSLEQAGAEVVINPLGRKLTEADLAGMIADFEVLIAGTEPITENVIERASQLKLIARVGIGLDSVDLLAARRHNIAVSY
ncbi:MAG: lactate dehydrogenase, partial [bacterium]